MKKSREKIFSYLLLTVFILSILTDWYRYLVIATTVILVVMTLDKMGKGIVLREIMALHSCFVCITMPLVGYIYYGREYELSRIWVKYMQVPEDIYFSFAVPAITGFAVAVCYPLVRGKDADTGPALKKVLERASGILKHIPTMGIVLMVLGLISHLTANFIPVVLQFAFYLFFFAAFSGFLYVYFAPEYKRKVPLLSLFAFLIFANALQSGMFTIVAYMGITMISFLFVGKKISFFKKTIVFAIGLVFVFLLQSVKHSYRAKTWAGDYEGSKVSLFLSLIGDQFSSQREQPFVDAFFPIYTRGNQGFNVSIVMQRIPYRQDFDGGINLFRSFLSSFVPRVFWPDKPEAGGKFNMMFYAGYNIEGWSTNVGPLGEAYGSFGVTGGIIYMIILGLVVRWTYKWVFRIGNRIPLIVFWIPMIFYQITYSAESDTLQITNSVIKSAFFVWALYRIWPQMFGVAKSKFGLSKRGLQTARRELAHK
jgi:hypothetical protein